MLEGIWELAVVAVTTLLFADEVTEMRSQKYLLNEQKEMSELKKIESYA